MAAEILPLPIEPQKASNWREQYFQFLDGCLDRIEKSTPMDKLWDITGSILENKSEILGQMALALIKKRYPELVDQEYHTCPTCKKSLKSRGKHKRELETMAGQIPVERPYFYCTQCNQGYYPLDEALGLCPQPKQYDIQDVEAWLSSELPFEMAREAFERCTGETLSAHSCHEATNRIAKDITVLDCCPTREQIEVKVDELKAGRLRRPVLMIAVDGALTPVRPEPCSRSGKRGKGDWKEAKGVRLYLIDSKKIIHILSWHQVATDQELARDLQIIKEAGLIPEKKVRVCLIGDGASWIWRKVREVFPSAKEVLDYYHCSQHLHIVAPLQYGKGTRQAQEWVEATLARLFHNQARHVIAGLKRMVPASAEARKEIEKLIRYLSEHKGKIDYGAARRGGYHIGSGAIESSNKFIGHVRLKRSGAWWYPTNANNILKLRCAKYNGTYDRVIELYRARDQEKLQKNKTITPEARN
jgi:hypothetical protein